MCLYACNRQSLVNLVGSEVIIPFIMTFVFSSCKSNIAIKMVRPLHGIVMVGCSPLLCSGEGRVCIVMTRCSVTVRVLDTARRETTRQGRRRKVGNNVWGSWLCHLNWFS